MSLSFNILGKPGNDNAVFIKIDSGHKLTRILLDTGANCLYQLHRNEIAALDHICFSHFHMDHICGFDSVFRLIYNKPEPIHIWGPRDTIKVIQARAMGFTWNLVQGFKNKIYIHEISTDGIKNVYIKLEDGYSQIYEESIEPFKNNFVFEDENILIQATILDHKIDCMAYAISERPRLNFINDKISELKLKPGAWCKTIKEQTDGSIKIGDQVYAITDLRKQILLSTPGKKIGYITDAKYDEKAKEKLLPILTEADEVVMECAYLDEEIALANKHHHMTVSQVSSFAKDAKIKHLNLFHISDRYPPEIRSQFLRKARETFVATDYPEHWGITE